jgi:uncharacterized protein with PIN domain
MITLRFYEELNDFLHYTKRKKSFSFILSGKRTIKDIIESLGVPHTEVDLILANGNPVSFDYHPEIDDHISVYPVFEAFDISGISLLRPKPLREPRFILDVHLGILARNLRLLGFDTFYRNDLQDEEIIRISLNEQRIILTRDRQMLKNGKVTHGHYVRNTNPEKQTREIVSHFDLKNLFRPFSRCLDCNGIIVRVEKDLVINQLLPKTRKAFHEFYQCQSCRKVYWKGSHYDRMLSLIEHSKP